MIGKPQKGLILHALTRGKTHITNHYDKQQQELGPFSSSDHWKGGDAQDLLTSNYHRFGRGTSKINELVTITSWIYNTNALL